MKKSVKTLIAPCAVVLSAAAFAPAAMAAGTHMQGAAFLTSNGNQPTMTQSGSAIAGNGVAGPRSALDVPEPSSIVAFGAGLALLAFGCARRKAGKR